MTEDLYVIRVKKDDASRDEKFGELEKILSKDERAKLRFLVKPVRLASAEIYSKELVDYLRDNGYEVSPEKKTKMI